MAMTAGHMQPTGSNLERLLPWGYLDSIQIPASAWLLQMAEGMSLARV